jgi:hypothetical protein
MSFAAITILVLSALTLAGWTALHGKTIKVNVLPKVLDTALILAILWWGGFFAIQ